MVRRSQDEVTGWGKERKNLHLEKQQEVKQSSKSKTYVGASYSLSSYCSHHSSSLKSVLKSHSYAYFRGSSVNLFTDAQPSRILDNSFLRGFNQIQKSQKVLSEVNVSQMYSVVKGLTWLVPLQNTRVHTSEVEVWN